MRRSGRRRRRRRRRSSRPVAPVRGPGADGEGGVIEDGIDRALEMLARRPERVQRESQ